jgi:hypothetical protein
VLQPPSEESRDEAPATVGIAVDVHERIHELERALREERRAIAELEDHYRVLEAKYREHVGATVDV